MISTRFQSKTKQRLFVGVILVLIMFGFFYAQLTSAATYTWDNGGGDNLWSTCTNWSSDVCPGSGDIAEFDGIVTDDAIIDVGFAGSVQGVSITSGYTGTITQQRDLTISTEGFAQADGVYNQGTSTFAISNASFAVTGGTFTTASGSPNTIERNVTIAAAATFTSSSTRIWQILGNNSPDDTVFTYTGTFPGTVDIAKSTTGAEFTLASGVITLMDDMSSNVGSVIVNNGATMHIAANAFTAFNLTISGQIFASSTVSLPGSFTLNSTGELFYDDTAISVEQNYTDNGGTFDESGITFTFNGANSGDDTTFTYTGIFPGVVDIVKGASGGSFTLVSGATIVDMLDMSTNNGSLTVNSGATMHIANNALNVETLTISGALYASSTIDINTNFVLDASGEFYFDGSTINVENNYTDGGGTFDESGITFVFDGPNSSDDTTFTHTGVFAGTVDINKTNDGGSFVLTTGASLVDMLDMSTNEAPITINDGATMHVANNVLDTANLIISGQLFSSSTIDIAENFTLNATGEFYFDGVNISIERNYTDNGGVFDSSGTTVLFDGGNSDDDTTFTHTGVFSGTIDIAKAFIGAEFTVAAGANVVITESTSLSPVTINGTLATEGSTLTASALTIGSTGVLRLHGDETVTTPVISSGGTIDYYGPGTYTSIGDYNYENITFSDGTYNVSGDVTVAGNFSNTGATFSQTSGTTTFTGTTNSISGDNTFFNLEKAATAASTLTLEAGDTQTIANDLILTGLDGSNRLSLISSNSGTQWQIDPQGERTLDFLSVTDGNNIAAAIVNCYDIDCVDGGNNTRIFFTPPFPTYRLQGGVRLNGGVRL